MPTCRVDWPQAWRIIASRYPPIRLFERLTDDPAVWDTLVALEQLTNPRVRDGRAPGRGVEAVGKSPAGATAASLA